MYIYIYTQRLTLQGEISRKGKQRNKCRKIIIGLNIKIIRKRKEQKWKKK